MIIGITGGIASGKSEVCHILEDLGFIHIDADDVAHDILEQPTVIDEIVSIFGNNILTENSDNNYKNIDRKKLGEIVFNSPEKMKILENITHPHIVAQIKCIIKQKEIDYVIEAIKLISSGLVDVCDELWVVHAEREQQINRLMGSRNLSYEEACSRLKAQENQDWDEANADRVIYSTEPIETMKKQVQDALLASTMTEI